MLLMWFVDAMINKICVASRKSFNFIHYCAAAADRRSIEYFVSRLGFIHHSNVNAIDLILHK